MKRARKILSYMLVAVMVILMLPSTTLRSLAAANYSFSGKAHVQTYGDQSGKWDGKTLTLGTTGQGKRLESVTINFNNQTGYDGSIEYRVHRQTYGWTNWVKSGQPAGTTGQGKRLEGLQLRLTGEIAKHYSIRYRVHIQTYGWNQGWQYDGAIAGTTGEAKRLEALEIQLVPKASETESVAYRVHRQTYGWEKTWATNGAVSGTTGQAKRLEGITIALTGGQYSGGITYRTHVQSYGWMSWCSDGEMSGTSGKAKRLEAIQIKLTGDVANYYDVYYRVHAQSYGWLGWAKNGETSGTEGLAKRLEAIQIVLVKKGASAPGTTFAGITATTNKKCVSKYEVERIYEYEVERIYVYGTTLTVGQSETLECNVYPREASKEGLKWTSSDSSVATVDSTGRVKAIAKGSAKITVTAPSGVSDSTTVTVRYPEGSVESVFLYSAYVDAGSTYDMNNKLSVSPSGASKSGMKWSVSDTSIATINQNGIVTAIKPGSVDVTVTAPTGESYTNTLTVRRPTATGLVIDNNSLTLKRGKMATLTANTVPLYSDASIYWKTSNSKVASVGFTTGIVEAKAEGTAIITAYTSSGLQATCEVTVGESVEDSVNDLYNYIMKYGNTKDGYKYITRTVTNNGFTFKSTITVKGTKLLFHESIEKSGSNDTGSVSMEYDMTTQTVVDSKVSVLFFQGFYSVQEHGFINQKSITKATDYTFIIDDFRYLVQPVEMSAEDERICQKGGDIYTKYAMLYWDELISSKTSLIGLSSLGFTSYK